jgi:hypothetical protein
MSTAVSTTATSTAETPEPVTGIERALTLVTLAAGGTSSLLVVAASAGLVPMPVLFWAVGLPGMLLVAVIGIYARITGMTRLAHRIGIGVLGGIALTMALDVFRVGGVHLGYLPDSASMFGAMITGSSPMADPTPAGYTLGALYHFFNGISFALVYSILFGRTRWWGPLLFSVGFVEVGMMILPPMAPKFGPFGLDKYASLANGYFLSTLLAHAAMGIVLGLIIQTRARHRGLLLTGLR